MLMKGQRLSYYAIVKVKVPLEKKAVSTTSVEEQKQDVADANETAKAAVTPSGKPNTSPETIYHMVQKGDTLWKIAQRYEGVTVEQIMKINSISNSKSLMPGTKLKVKVNG